MPPLLMHSARFLLRRYLIHLYMIYLVVAAIIFVYFFPSYLAFAFRHADWKGVFFVNLAIGWTIIGWFACLVWVFDWDKTN